MTGWQRARFVGWTLAKIGALLLLWPFNMLATATEWIADQALRPVRFFHARQELVLEEIRQPAREARRAELLRELSQQDDTPWNFK